VIAIDAATYGVLAATYRWAPAGQRRDRVPPTSSRSQGLAVIRDDPRLLGLVALTFGFFFLYGPVEVGLPLHISEDRGGSAALGWTARPLTFPGQSRPSDPRSSPASALPTRSPSC
jgi:DHA3 family macrolide efflux protein-like MFS transporter